MTDLINEWQQFLAQHGTAADATAVSDNFFAPLSDLGIITVSGEEAAHFLHNQLTNDVATLTGNHARLAGYCSPKGRLLSTMLMWRMNDNIMLQLPRSILATTQKRLNMFVLRTKAKLRDASDEYVAIGLAGTAAETVLQTWFPQLPAAPYDKQESEAGVLIRLTDADHFPRFEWITSPVIAMAAWPQLCEQLMLADCSRWNLSEIRAGIPCVTLSTQEKFVPQMINYELIGGVNFKKGCYPGQEIVARSQYLGKLKRRAMLASIAGATVEPGMEVFSATDLEQPCGMIVNAAPSGLGQTDCLVEIKVAALEDGTVQLGTTNGVALQFKALPYPFPDAV